jgi:hypothetical protein
MGELELAAEIADLLGQQTQCVLATMNETGPCQHVMAFECVNNPLFLPNGPTTKVSTQVGQPKSKRSPIK